MAQTISSQGHSPVLESRHRVPVGLWHKFVQQVATYRPNVAILVARKMPRLQEAFGLDFGASVTCSDLAIPYVTNYHAGARIAIVDDVINIGTTMRHAYERVRSCNAADVRLFALAARPNHSLSDLPLRTVVDAPMMQLQYRELVDSVPEIIQTLAKPYDIEFPVFRCTLAPWVTSALDVLDWAKSRYGDAVQDLLWPNSLSHLRRITIDLPRQVGARKVRLYIDEDRRVCSFVPFVLPDTLSHLHMVEPVARDLAEYLAQLAELAPPETQLWPGEAVARARLFCASLDLGLQFISEFSKVILPLDENLFSLRDAVQLFGPAIRDFVPSGAGPFTGAQDDGYIPTDQRCTPFVDQLGDDGFLNEVVRLASSHYGDTAADQFAAIFDVLAQLVHANESTPPQLKWPYAPEDVAVAPYLRLRIGPTFQDLCAIMQHLRPELQDCGRVVRLVSGLLDISIDSGAVVPTIARYDGRFYRVYRRGETEYRDSVRQRLQLAHDRLQASGRTISMTRMAKINAILAYSSALPELLWPASRERGTVATIQEVVLDQSGAEAGQYLRDCGAFPSPGQAE